MSTPAGYWHVVPSAGAAIHWAAIDAESLAKNLCAGSLYAILDAARHRDVLAMLCEPGVAYWSLYDGRAAQQMADVAPYLIDLRRDPRRLHDFIENGWGDFWGFYLHSNAEPDEVRSHLRHFTMVRLEDGDEVFFRFYDPRVLRPFLEFIEPGDGKKFFGPIKRILCEGDTGATVFRFEPLSADAGSGAEKRG